MPDSNNPTVEEMIKNELYYKFSKKEKGFPASQKENRKFT